ncbi:MAG: hypothetical protein RL220_509 [Bacteroidota bacterium]
MSEKTISLLREIISGELPGERAHARMTLRGRIPAREAMLLDPPPRNSAVLIMMYRKQNKWFTALMKRPDYEGVHGGQVSFPGGKEESEDQSLLHTALREGHEETGIHSDQLHPIGALSRIYIPPSHFLVHPFVAYSPVTPEFQPNQREVESIIEIEPEQLLSESAMGLERVFIRQQNLWMKVPAFNIGGQVVWGATAMILSEFVEVFQPVFRMDEPK